MGIKRRTFLQQTSLALLGWGISQKALSWFERRTQLGLYSQALAQTTSRKLALLVGIDRYKSNNALRGCLTDVELQQELLVHRFGFQPQDIITLTDTQATRENIETAFEEHLHQQAQAEDIVVFHFSGLGTQLQLPPVNAEAESEENLVNALLPIDYLLADGETTTVNGLLLETLTLLVRSLATDKVTVVLDTSYGRSAKTLAGSLRFRSLVAPTPGQISLSELAVQEQLKAQVNSSLTKRYLRSGKLPGIFLTAAQEEQQATEFTSNSLSAGLFTHAWTQYLWQITPASRIQVSYRHTAEELAKLRGKQQLPQLTKTQQQPFWTYYLLPENQSGGEAVVTGVDTGGSVNLKLLGLPIQLLPNYGISSCFTSLPATAESAPVTLQLQTKNGLTAKAKVVGESKPIQPGQILQESVRVIPRNLGLNVALEQNLSKIERVDATSAFSNLKIVTSTATAGEEVADCLLAKVERQPAIKSNASEENSPEHESDRGYGLLSADGILLPNTLGKANEAVKSAVARFQKPLETLLATKLWRLIANEDSALLPVRIALEVVDSENSSIVQKTTRGAIRLTKTEAEELPASLVSEAIATIKLGSRLQYRLENYSDRPLYLLALGLDARGRIIAFDPVPSSPPLIPAQTTQVFPVEDTAFNWIVSGATGYREMQLILSVAPFTETIATLSDMDNTQADVEQLVNLNTPLPVVQALLQDLHNASGVAETLISSGSDLYALDVKSWASLSFFYEVV